MDRVGKKFMLGNTYLSRRGIFYSWPGEDSDFYDSSFKARKESIGDYLLERAKFYMSSDHGKTVMFPHITHGEKGETIFVDTNCACMTFGPLDFGCMVIFIMLMLPDID